MCACVSCVCACVCVCEWCIVYVCVNVYRVLGCV